MNPSRSWHPYFETPREEGPSVIGPAPLNETHVKTETGQARKPAHTTSFTLVTSPAASRATAVPSGLADLRHRSLHPTTGTTLPTSDQMNGASELVFCNLVRQTINAQPVRNSVGGDTHTVLWNATL